MGKDNFHHWTQQRSDKHFFTPTIALHLAHYAPTFPLKWGVGLRLYSLSLNLIFPRNLIHHLLVLGDCGKRVVLKSQWSSEYKPLCLNPYSLLIMKNINAFFSFQKRVFAERLTHYAPYFFGVHAKPNLIAWKIRGCGHKSAGRNKYAYDTGAKCDAQHVTCYCAVCGVYGGRFHIDVFNEKLVLWLFLQIWMAALSTLKRRAKALIQVPSSREIRNARLCYRDVAVGLIAPIYFWRRGWSEVLCSSFGTHDFVETLFLSCRRGQQLFFL